MLSFPCLNAILCLMGVVLQWDNFRKESYYEQIFDSDILIAYYNDNKIFILQKNLFEFFTIIWKGSDSRVLQKNPSFTIGVK